MEEAQPHYLSKGVIMASHQGHISLRGREPAAPSGQIIQPDVSGTWDLERKRAEVGNFTTGGGSVCVSVCVHTRVLNWGTVRIKSFLWLSKFGNCGGLYITPMFST